MLYYKKDPAVIQNRKRGGERMATIHCKACGAIYHYEKEGCCPNCGAYNRPPKRDRVNADGTVQRMTDAAYEKRQHAQGKVCFEEKECHEEKVCYENQARQSSRSPAPKPTGPAPHSKFPETPSAPLRSTPAAKQKSGSPAGCLTALFIVIVLAALVGTVFREISDSISPRIESQWEETTLPEEETELEPEVVDWIDVTVGEPIHLEDGSILTVLDWPKVDGEQIIVRMDTELTENGNEVYVTLVCLDENSEPQYLEDFDTQTDPDGATELIFSTTDYGDLEPVALVLEEWDGEADVGSWWVDLSQ